MSREGGRQISRWTTLGSATLLNAALVLVLICVVPGEAMGQAAEAPPPPPVTREAAREMVARLSDAEVRKLLLEHLDRSLAEAEEAQAAEREPWLLTESGTALSRLNELVGRFDELDDEWRRLDGIIRGSMRYPWLILLAVIAAGVAVGALLERFLMRPNGILGVLSAVAPQTRAEQIRAGRVLLGAFARGFGAAVFLAGALAIVQLVPGISDGVRLLASAAVLLAGGTRVVAAGINGLFFPAGDASPWPLSNRVARAVLRHLTVVTALTLLNVLDGDVLNQLGAQPFFAMAFQLMAGGLLIAGIIVGIFAVRNAMGPAAAEGGRGALSLLLRDRWHMLATAYVLVIYVLAVYARLATGESVLLPGLVSLSLVLLVPALDYGVRLLAARLVPAPVEPASVAEASEVGGAGPHHVAESKKIHLAASAQPPPSLLQAEQPAKPDELAPAPGDSAPAPSQIEHALVVNFRILLALAVLTAVGELWGIRPFDLVEAIFGARLAGALGEIAVASLFAIIVWQIVKAALLTHAPREPTGAGAEGDGGGVGQTRVQTLIPLVAKTLGVVLIVMLALIALSAFGVNIGPLLAGAGVVGLAVGFGAQTLVRDIVSGIFFLVDDAFRMGEYLEIGDIRGTVEKISLRSLRLRHHNGPLHTLPYGEIQSMTNYSRDYAIMKFEIRVPFETNVEKVRKLIKQVGAELAKDEELAPVMLEPLKSQGVNRMDDSAFVIRCKFTTVPGKQFMVRRYAYAKIQQAFEKEGIHFAPKRVIVETVAPAGSEEALAAAAAAAAQAEAPPRKASADER
jgi:small-conductance mechanosensitive channel